MLLYCLVCLSTKKSHFKLSLLYITLHFLTLHFLLFSLSSFIFCLFCFQSFILFFSLCPANLSVVFLHVAENLSEQIALFSYYLNGGGWYYN